MTPTSLDSQLPEVGVRINYLSNLGTVRFVGEVEGSRGIWLGVEWDDPRRGKHSGSKDGKIYFTCAVPNSGSFVRPSPSVNLGRSFLHALVSKYVEIPFETPVEKVMLGSSKGAIEVEVVGMNKVRNKLSRLERLREVSLDMENVGTVDAPGEIRAKCPNVKGLDISRSLIPSWEVLARITGELPLLETLSLNFNRLQLPSKQLPERSFAHVQDLRLNGTLTTWEEFLSLLPSFPELLHLEMGLNRIRFLTVAAASPASAKLATLNFEENQLDDWQNIMDSVAVFVQLNRIILSGNMIERITPPCSSSVHLRQVKHLALTSNGIKSWSDIDALRAWFPQLETLKININPIVQDTSSRALIIARLSSLVALNASIISSAERRDSELFYLSSIGKSNVSTEESREREYPRYRELCKKYGKPEERRQVQPDTLSNRLIATYFYRLSSPVSSTTYLDLPTPEFTLRVLPSMTLRVLCLKVFKTLKITTRTSIRLWLLLEREGVCEYAELDMELVNRSIEWWGVEENSKIAFLV